MIVVTLMWSVAGVVTRHLEAARSFEVTFWRSLFNALALGAALTVMRGPALWTGLLRAPWPVWLSGVCWSVMFTAFMVAITMTSVAGVLITMSVAPLITALFARLALHHHLPPRTWGAIAAAGAGIAWMFGRDAQAAGSTAWAGMLVAAAVPVASAINYTLLQHTSRGQSGGQSDMLPAVLIGAVLSTVVTLPLALPFQASPHDLGWLAMLGVFQLAIPCLLIVRLTRQLPAPEIALLGLLEVLFGVLWAWLGADEQPSSAALLGGSLVLGALVFNELLGWRRAARPARSARVQP